MLYVCVCVWNVYEICVNSICDNSMDVWIVSLYCVVQMMNRCEFNGLDCIPSLCGTNGESCFVNAVCVCVCVFGIYHMKYVSIQCVIIQWMLIFNGC